MTSRFCRLSAVVLAIVLAAAVSSAREKKPRPDLTGAWAFDGEKSDSPASADSAKGKGSSHKPIFGPPRGGFGPISGAGGGGPMVKSRPDEETVARSKELTRIFTLRQAEVVQALRKGKANKIIAYELNLRESTVKVHIRNIMKKLKATNRTEVAYKLNDMFQ